jgi:hypothetical protein
MTAAASSGYDLLVYTPTVDSDGFDLIIDDRDFLLPLQLKSVIFDGKASRWTIHRKLIRPRIHEIEWFGFEPSACGEGRGGGVLLIEIHGSSSVIELSYLYTDLRILTAIWLGIIPKPAASLKRLIKLRQDLEAEPSGKVSVPRSAFLRVRSPNHLLALAGLHSSYHGAWPNQLYQLARHEYEGNKLSAPKEKIIDLLRQDVGQLYTKRRSG